jgi:hypothetical protein
MNDQITPEEQANITAHADHRWADITTYSSVRRKLVCLDCIEVFDAGPIALSLTEPLESKALRAERAAQNKGSCHPNPSTQTMSNPRMQSTH